MSQFRVLTVAIHAHSTWSYDGHWTLARVAQLFGSAGYDAVMMSEHDTGFDPDSFEKYRAECVEYSTARCRLIPGIEYSCPNNDVHILTYGLSTFLAEHQPVLETLTAVADARGAAIFAHPIRRSAFDKFDSQWTNYLHAIELWNRKADGVAPSDVAGELIERTGLPSSVGTDFHRLRHFWPLAMKMSIRDSGVDQTLESALVDALRERRFHSAFLGRKLKISRGRARTPVSRAIETARVRLRDIMRPKRKRGLMGSEK